MVITSTSTLPGFLGLEDKDFQLIEKYLSTLEEGSPTLAASFYDYLLSHPITAAVFRDFSPERLDALIQKQTLHVNNLLESRLNRTYRESMCKIGALHHQLGIEPAWVAGAYLLYWRQWQEILQQRVPEIDQTPLRDTLFRLLIGDLMVQLDGYAHASRQTDAERLALFDVLLGVLAMPDEEHSPRPEGLLSQICEALPRKSKKILFAGYAINSGTERLLTLEYLAGISATELQIPAKASDLCWSSLTDGKVIIQLTADPAAPAWMSALKDRVAEIAIFPFGAEDLHGVGLVGVRDKGYFKSVGSVYFDAFAHLGELVLLLRNQSLRDPLTGLPNRALFLDRLTVARAQAVRRNSILAVIILDLDGFKQVNDHLGHGAGDSLLLGVVKRIQTLLRAGDTLARMGGDEFGLLIPNLTQVNDIEGLSDRILAAIKEPFEIHGEQVSVSGSMGITLYPDPDEGDPDTLIRHADMALYAAKDLGKDQYYLHTFALDDALNHERNTRSLVEQALDEDRMLLYYQPIVSTQGQVVGMEALIRMQDPIKGILAPVAFASALDHPKLARRIGCFVLEAAIKQAEQWQETGLNLDVSINISPRHLLDSRFIQDLQETLARHSALAANRIELEVTESAPLTDMNGAQSQLAACRVLGVNIALDDFGTGNASLTYLQQLNVQCIKIDQNFVRDIIHDPKDLAIVAALITASRMLGLKVIAEGVEDNDHAELLAGLGCNLLQGYFFTRPLPAAEIPTWIERFQSLAQKAQGECAIDILPPIMEGHRLRFLQFARALDQGTDFPGFFLEQGAAQQCHLGRWLHSEGKARYGNHPLYTEVLNNYVCLYKVAEHIQKAKLIKNQSDIAILINQLTLENNRLTATLEKLIHKTVS